MIVSGRVRVNRPFFYTDTNGARADFPAMGEGTADLDGHELSRFEADVRGGMIERIAAPGAEPEAEPAPPADDFTREGIAKMDKADVLDLLEAHGWDGNKRLGVDKLRAELVAIMFVGE